jgi:hypothetical protein
MFRFLKSLLVKDAKASRAPARGRPPRPVRLALEGLEGRLTPGGGIWDGGDDYVASEPAVLSTSSTVYLPSAPIYPPGPCVVF